MILYQIHHPKISIAVETRSSNPLNCDNYPFCRDLLDISEELKIFFNKVLAMKGDIFETFSISRALVKKIILEGISSPILKLEDHTMLNIPSKTVSEVAEKTEIARNLE